MSNRILDYIVNDYVHKYLVWVEHHLSDSDIYCLLTEDPTLDVESNFQFVRIDGFIVKRAMQLALRYIHTSLLACCVKYNCTFHNCIEWKQNRNFCLNTTCILII